jgi:hypothetical protein
MVEGAISALHQLAKEPSVAKYIYKRPGVMNVLVDVMHTSLFYYIFIQILAYES